MLMFIADLFIIAKNWGEKQISINRMANNCSLFIHWNSAQQEK